MLLHHAAKHFEDVLINGEKLGELKGSDVLQFGQGKIFETADGNHLAQSWSILRYLGRTYGYYPGDADAAL